MAAAKGAGPIGIGKRKRSSWSFWANKVRGKLKQHRHVDANIHPKQDGNAAYNSKAHHQLLK